MINSSGDQSEQVNPTELQPGLVILCLSCGRRRVIEKWWLERISETLPSLNFSLIQPRLICSCKIKGKTILTHPKVSKDDILHLYKLLRLKKLSIKEFAEEVKILANEGNLFAVRWLNESRINKSLIKEREREDARARRLSEGGNYNTKPWFDWQTGLPTRRGKRHRMYE